MTRNTICRFKGHYEAKTRLFIEGASALSDQYTVYWHFNCLRCSAVRTEHKVVKPIPRAHPVPSLGV